MTITAPNNSEIPRKVLTPEQIEQTFDQLGLNDPQIRKFYDALEELNPQELPQFQLRTSHHTSLP